MKTIRDTVRSIHFLVFRQTAFESIVIVTSLVLSDFAVEEIPKNKEIKKQVKVINWENDTKIPQMHIPSNPPKPSTVLYFI